MSQRRRAALGVGIVAAIFLFVQVAALALVEPFQAAGYQPVEDPQDPTNSLAYFGAILVATAVMLAAFKFGVDEFIRLLVIGSGAWLSLYVFQVLIPPVVTVGSFNLVAVACAAALGIALYVYPEWYVIDVAGAFMGAAAAGLFGISFGILPALLLLTVLAVYDAISVYGTEHMLTLASGVMDLRVPVVLVIPFSASYSFLETDPSSDTALDEDAEGDGADGDPADADEADVPDVESEQSPLDREAMFIGLGDAVIPTVLVASAAFFAPEGIAAVVGVPVTALAAMVGTFAGLAGLLWMVMKGRAHAGLPLLNGGAIGGYLLGALASGLTLIQALGL
ncbi:presenilin family intramembrane aspartyl protease PSH [Halomicrobium salinisoli]|uniref:presenilin family intramembrane aspartyl protease PSH n=1 Tax=Halomicrobium salinisoli TaxID=2878391 RepID=UPI001CF06562|nr:presenilin family intramembrane aspartyl protease PSH [Halomicrobium salinisoli]